jgi:glutathione S-transferase
MAKLKIHGIIRSRASRNIWTAEECGVKYDHVKVNWTDGGTQKPAYLKIAPMGQVPAIEDGAFSLFESMAINLYIAKKYGKRLYPSDLKAEAKVWQWTMFAATEIERDNGIYGYNTWMRPEAERDVKAAAEAWESLAKPFGVLDKVLAKSPFLLGRSFSIADINVASVLMGSWLNKVDFSPWKNLNAWLKRCYERPAAKRVIALREQG